MRPALVLACLFVAACSRGPAMVTLYCYETLADSACYAEPDPGRGNRLLAVVDVPLTATLAVRLGAEP
jgi:hypothetical protein